LVSASTCELVIFTSWSKRSSSSASALRCRVRECPNETKPTADRPKIKAFREWLVSEAKADEAGMKALGIFAPVSQ